MRYWIFVLLICFAAPLLAEDAPQDELTTTEEETLVGKFVKIDAGKVYFESATLGLLKFDVEDVSEIKLAASRKMFLREGEKDEYAKYREVTVTSKDGKLFAGDKEITPKTVGFLDAAPPDNRPDWTVGAFLSFGWTEGNTKTYELDGRFDITRTTKHTFSTLFGEANYLQDRERDEEPVLERNFLLGAAFRYVFDFRLTIDATQDFYFNELAGYHFRSITGVGPGYYFTRSHELTTHAGLHLVYVYEDLMNRAENRGYFGARVRGEVDTWQLEDDFHLNFKTEVIFDFDEPKNVMWNNLLLVDYHFAEHFTAGLLISHQFDNLPAPGFFHHDWKFLITLGFSWGGKWY
ncbi:MAG: DUF481 domain-containing protein [Planctomycetes bacterium]|nr:DUF481 domain-containing protein [Planctomycetota bacterium]